MSIETETSINSLKRLPVGYLSFIFQGRKERNPAYSLRAFARDIGVSTSLLSRIFSGARPLSLKLAMQIATALDLREEETNALVLSVLQNSSKTAKISKKLRSKLEKTIADSQDDHSIPLYTTLDIEQFKAMASWYHLALLNLTTVDDFQSDPKWIAEQLGISSIEARSAIERLIGLGLLTEEGNSLRRTQRSYTLKTSKSHLAIRKFHKEMIAKSQNALECTEEAQFQRRLINGITFACAPEHIELIKEKIDRLQDEILALTDSGNKKEVYQMNVQFFPLTEINRGEVK